MALSVGQVQVEAAARHLHGGLETFRLIFHIAGKRVALFGDGATTAGARRMAGADVAVLHCLLPHPLEGIDHLDPVLTAEILRTARPQRAIITHFGGGILKHGLADGIARRLAEETGVPCVAATDGMVVPL